MTSSNTTREQRGSPCASPLDQELDRLAGHFIRRGLSINHLVPLLESAELRELNDGEHLFEQFHPAHEFYLLITGTAKQATASASRTGLVHHASIDWPYAALGWSGFLPPHRYGSTVVAGETLAVLCWPHERLAEIFYADPLVSVHFFDLVLDSVSRHLRNLRRAHLSAQGAFLEPPDEQAFDARRPVVGRADSCLRRSAFFAPFDDSTIDRLAAGAELESFLPGQRIVRQDDRMNSLLLLASGRCNVFFEPGDDDDTRLMPHRRLHNRNGIIAGVPVESGGLSAEATVYAESHCWIYRLPAAVVQQVMMSDPEFARAFQQRLLMRLAGLVGALQVERNAEDAEPEVAQVSNIIANSQARLPVTSDLFKLPHLLSHRLTVSNAIAVLNKVADTGRYHERLVAARCEEVIEPLVVETSFFQDIVDVCEQVIASDKSTAAEDVRSMCDERVGRAFSHLDCRVIGEENLPAEGGNIFVLNHLACPEYYQLPNGYHFSFDTAFVSHILWKHFGHSALRVIRESPGAEFGHNLFYRNLGHITVPTIESELEHLDEAAFIARRRAAGQAFSEQGRRLLGDGMNLLMCPEGQSQPAELSPARFHTGAFRLAAETGAPVVPVAVAGFQRRFKDGPLAAIIGAPVDVSSAMAEDGFTSVRQFADRFRDEFSVDVRRASAIANGVN